MLIVSTQAHVTPLQEGKGVTSLLFMNYTGDEETLGGYLLGCITAWPTQVVDKSASNCSIHQWGGGISPHNWIHYLRMTCDLDVSHGIIRHSSLIPLYQ